MLPSQQACTWRRDLGLLTILLVTALGLRTWSVQHARVTARDSIGFIRYAWQLQHEPWGEVLRRSLHPPVYPLTVLAASYPVCAWQDRQDSLSMQLSAQCASALAGILLVFPMFFLGKELFDRTVAFWATLWFQCLPVSAHAMADGLTEASYLLMLICALFAGVLALNRRWAWCWSVCGLFGGLAYLTRPEGILMVVSGGAVLVAMAAVRTWRVSWKHWSISFASFLILASAVSVPYMVTIGRFSNKTTTRDLVNQDGEASLPIAAPPLLFAAWSPDYVEGIRSGKTWWAIKAIAQEINKAFHYLTPLAIAGFWWFRKQFRAQPGWWLVGTLVSLQLIVLWRLASFMGYVSERHCLLLVLCGCFWASAFVIDICSKLSRAAGWREWAVASCTLVVLVGSCLPGSLKPLHAGRIGHREAGLWLADHAEPFDFIDDPLCWASYYAGRVFVEGTPAETPAGYQPVHFVVLDQLDKRHDRVPTYNATRDWAVERGSEVFRWPLNRPANQAEVLVYAVKP